MVFEAGINSVNPPLTGHQRIAIMRAAQKAWERLWIPPPENCAEDFRHSFLNDLEREKVIERIEELNNFGASDTINLLNMIAAEGDELQRTREEVQRTEAVAPYVDSKRERIAELNDEITNIDRELGALRRETNSLEGQKNQKNTELTKMAGQWDAAKPAERRASRALKVSSMVDEIVTKAVPSQIKAIANAMTYAHKSMAHKKDLVERINITEDCEVELLNADGIDGAQLRPFGRREANFYTIFDFCGIVGVAQVVSAA